MRFNGLFIFWRAPRWGPDSVQAASKGQNMAFIFLCYIYFFSSNTKKWFMCRCRWLSGAQKSPTPALADRTYTCTCAGVGHFPEPKSDLHLNFQIISSKNLITKTTKYRCRSLFCVGHFSEKWPTPQGAGHFYKLIHDVFESAGRFSWPL